MDNRIVHVELRDRSISAASAEVHVVVRPAKRTAQTALRGRLTGPRCRFASTVEVAYHVRPLSDAGRPADTEELIARVVIPEPSLWDPQSPFLYGGPVELWDGDERRDVVQVRHGLRRLQFGPGGLAVNGRRLVLRVKQMPAGVCSEAEALELRKAGYNVLVAPVSNASVPLWDVGDRFGFLIAGQVVAPDETTLSLLASLRTHPSCLGWLAPGLQLPGQDILTPDAVALIERAD